MQHGSVVSHKRNYTKHKLLRICAQIYVYFPACEERIQKNILPLLLSRADSWQISQEVKWDQILSPRYLTLIFSFLALHCRYLRHQLEPIDLGAQADLLGPLPGATGSHPITGARDQKPASAHQTRLQCKQNHCSIARALPNY